MNPQTKSSRLDKILFILLQAVVVFTPLFFLPYASVPFDLGKIAFVLLGTLVIFFIWTLARLKDGTFEVPKSLLYASSGIAVLVYALSAIFSPNKAMSFSGQFFELGTLGFFLVSFILFAIIPLIVKTKEKLFYVYTSLFVSFALVGLYQLIRLFAGPSFLSFGVLINSASNLVGKWNDLAIFFGLSTLLSVITLERTPLSNILKYLVYVCLGLSLVFLVIVGFTPVWMTLSAFLVVFFIYSSASKKDTTATEGSSRKLPRIAVVVLVISLILSFAGQSVANLTSKLGISQVEVRPSWSATLDIAQKTLVSHPVFGVGPNRFSSEWQLNKPNGINSTLFWNTNFNYGIGFIPTFFTNSGFVGLLGILLFVLLFLYTGIKGIFSKGNNPFGNYLVLSSFLSSLYLWVFAFIYVPSASIWTLTMILTGLFVTALVLGGTLSTTRFSSIDSPIKGFISVLVTVLVLISTIAFGYSVSVKALANIDYQRALIAVNNNGNLDLGEKYITNAINLSDSDSYQRFMAELYLVRVNNLLNDKNISADEARTKFQNLLAVSIKSGQAAIAIDPTDYQNHLEMGRVFEAVVPLNITGAYESSKKSYEDALALNPHDPEIYLILARLESSHKSNENAISYIQKALAEKSDYADAIFLLSQIEINQGKLSDAIKSLQNVAILSPNDPGVFFQLGLLQYNQKDYKSAVESFGRAVALNPQYANAKYFLGLSDYQVGNKQDAINQFQDLKVSNPDNAEVKSILSNLQAGRAPFANQANSTPEKRSKPPVSDTSTDSQSL